MKQRTVNIISLIIGVLGFSFAIFVFVLNTKKSSISYYIDDPVYKVFDKTSISDEEFSIYLKDSMLVDENIYLASFSVWNSGNLSIDSNLMRTDSFLIQFSGIESILSINRIKERKEGISDISIIQTNDSTFNLDWTYFDPKDGSTFQILYFGEESLSIRTIGLIYGTKIINYNNVKSQSNILPSFRDRTVLLILILAVIFALLLSIFFYKNPNSNIPKKLLGISEPFYVFEGKFLYILFYFSYNVLIIIMLLLILLSTFLPDISDKLY